MAEENSQTMTENAEKKVFSVIDYEDWKAKKEIKQTKTGRVDQIIDALTLSLKDGTIIRLTGIDIPDRFQPRDNLYEQAAFMRLKELLPERTEIYLFQTRKADKGRTNRMGHSLAHIVTKDENIWIQGQLLEDGFARVYAMPSNNQLVDDLYKIESNAREAKKGIWQDNSAFKLLTLNELSNKNDEFIVVEATVQKVATVRNNIYLNFGSDWKNDFTVMITPEKRRAFSKKQIDPLTLGKEVVRVRGWVREYNGPFIELEDISHLEILPKGTELNTLGAE